MNSPIEAQIEKKFRAKYPETGSFNIRGSTIELDEGRKLFFKIGTGGSRADTSLLHYEAEGLTRLADAAGDALEVPRPWLVDLVQLPAYSSGFIIMDEIELGGRRSAEAQRSLGYGLAKIHKAPMPEDWDEGCFGFPMDGCCGSLKQPNNAENEPLNWASFWAKHRLGFQLDQCRSDTIVQELGAELLSKLDALFDVDDIQPSLLHGDLWAGNHAVSIGGKPCIYDPAAYYGHSGDTTVSWLQRARFTVRGPSPLESLQYVWRVVQRWRRRIDESPPSKFVNVDLRHWLLPRTRDHSTLQHCLLCHMGLY